ncbi:unnamed protein product [Darwinula stevensoni]|uniref:Uncharacterized protein n=1 Tax=Darwinula stevensoni TaxID=69355 RepID=A0A7R8WXM7_9CRUS|nr:unnamed protein product [Darwinula stevensoni]CAG0878588.1 unnamed protein product [Darwinula stevensoni]
MIMSSFLMSSAASPYVQEPKFPPTEEYSQSSYIPNHGASEYYHHQGGYGYASAPVHHPHHHPQYPRDNMGYGGPPAPVQGYYQQPCAMPLSQPLPGHVAPSVGVPVVQTQSPILGHRSPVSSPQPPYTPNSANLSQQPPQQQQGGLQQQSCHSGTTPPIPDCSQAQQPGCQQAGEDSDSSGSQPVIYPWMKKLHVAGAGKYLRNYPKFVF